MTEGRAATLGCHRSRTPRFPRHLPFCSASVRFAARTGPAGVPAGLVRAVPDRHPFTKDSMIFSGQAALPRVRLAGEDSFDRTGIEPLDLDDVESGRPYRW